MSTKWNPLEKGYPVMQGKYLASTNRGIRMVVLHSYPRIPAIFQDLNTGDDEGMTGWYDEPFTVTHWAHLPELPDQSDGLG